MATVTKKEIVNKIADKTQVKKVVVKKVAQSLLDEIINELVKGNKLEFRGFGIFDTRNTPPRIAHNPKTLEPVKVRAKTTVKFRMGNLMKQRLAEDK